jgi:plastocyanin
VAADAVAANAALAALDEAGDAVNAGGLEDEAAAPDDTPDLVADDTDTDDLDALFASVTPGAHRDLTSGGKAPKPNTLAAPAPEANALAAPGTRRHSRATRPRTAAPVVAPPSASSGPWKLVALIASGGFLIILVAFLAVFVYNLGAGPSSAAAANATSAPTASGPTVDLARVSALMAQLQTSPNDLGTLQSLGDEYFKGNDWANAGTFYDKALAVDPKSITVLLARGATYYNAGDDANAEKTWKQVVTLNPSDKSQAQEVHYDLGFLYLNAATPNWTGVVTEWNQVIAIDATTQIAKVVQQHLTSLAEASMIPASLVPASAAPGASGAPAASGAASPAPSGSVAPSGSGAAPSASPAANVVNEGAQNLAFTSNTLKAPANAAFTIHFNNQDSGLPHDMMIKDSAGATVFSGDMVTGPSAVDYQVPALKAGTYTFTCTIHPTTMNGTLVVGS